MTKLSPESRSDLMHRFYDFYDAVVCDVEIRLRGESPACQIVVQSQDREADSGWSTVTFDVHRPSEFRFELGRTTFEVLSSGIQIAWRAGSIYLVLDAYPDDDGELPDLRTNSAYVAGAECLWAALPVELHK